MKTDIPTTNVNFPFAQFAEAVPDGMDIVELGTYLGYATRAMAAAVYGKDIIIHTYDKFKAFKTALIERAEKEAGLHLKRGQSTLDIVRNNLSLFKNVVLHRCDIREAIYQGDRYIGLYLVDAIKKDPEFTQILNRFKPFFVPKITVLLLMTFDPIRYLTVSGDDRRYRKIEQVADRAAYLYLGEPEA